MKISLREARMEYLTSTDRGRQLEAHNEEGLDSRLYDMLDTA